MKKLFLFFSFFLSFSFVFAQNTTPQEYRYISQTYPQTKKLNALYEFGKEYFYKLPIAICCYQGTLKEVKRKKDNTIAGYLLYIVKGDPDNDRIYNYYCVPAPNSDILLTQLLHKNLASEHDENDFGFQILIGLFVKKITEEERGTE